MKDKLNVEAFIGLSEVLDKAPISCVAEYYNKNGKYTDLSGYLYSNDDEPSDISDFDDSELLEEIETRGLSKLPNPENLEESELQNAFIEAAKRCRPRDLITILETAK